MKINVHEQIIELWSLETNDKYCQMQINWIVQNKYVAYAQIIKEPANSTLEIKEDQTTAVQLHIFQMDTIMIKCMFRSGTN